MILLFFVASILDSIVVVVVAALVRIAVVDVQWFPCQSARLVNSERLKDNAICYHCRCCSSRFFFNFFVVVIIVLMLVGLFNFY